MPKNQKISNDKYVKSIDEESQNIGTNSNNNVSKFPVSLEFFKKWTHYEEIIELSLRSASRGDENKYQKLKRMPTFSENAIRNYYTLFYLKPKIREKYPIRMKPIPKHVKEKLLQIPNKTKSKYSSKPLLGNKRRKLVIGEEISKKDSNGDCNHNITRLTKNGIEMQTNSDDVSNYFRKSVCEVDVERGRSNLELSNKQNSANDVKTAESKKKEHIILENSNLPPTDLNTSKIINKNCDITISDCIFCHFPLSDFKKSTNVTDLIKESLFDACEIEDPDLLYNAVRVFYIKCLLKMLSPDETANLSMSLQKYKLLSRYHEICNKCKVRYNVEKADHTYVINSSFTDIDPVILVKNTYDNQDENILRDCHTRDDDNDETTKCRRRFINVLRDNLKERLARNWSLNEYIAIDYVNFKKKISYKEPLQQIIKFITSSDEVLSKEIIHDDAMYDLILKEFYLNYFVNHEIREKYPLKFNATCVQLSPGGQQSNTKSIIENSNDRIPNYCMDSPSTANGVYYSGIFNNKFLLCYINRIYQDPIKKGIVLKRIRARFPALTSPFTNSYAIELPNVLIETDSNLNDQKQTRHIKLTKANMKQSLAYILLTSHGFMYKIAKEISNLTFEEFRSLTCIYENDQLKSDFVSMDIYRHVIVEKHIWPINLFIKLKSLLTFLLSRNVEFSNGVIDNLLEHIPPIILHWSDLIQTTNFKNCCRIDYLKCSGKNLDINNTLLLNNRCVVYYSRCWKHNKWIWQTPKMTGVIMEDINQAFLRHICSTSVISSAALTTAISTPIVLPPTIAIMCTSTTKTTNSLLLTASNATITLTLSSSTSLASSKTSTSTTACKNKDTICNNQTQLNDCLRIYNLSGVSINEEQSIYVDNLFGKDTLNLRTATNYKNKNDLRDNDRNENANPSKAKISPELIDGTKKANLALVTVRKKSRRINSCTTHNTKDKTNFVPQFSHEFRALPLQFVEISSNNLQNNLTHTKSIKLMKRMKNNGQISQELPANSSMFNNVIVVTPHKSAFGKVRSSASSTLVRNPSNADEVSKKCYSYFPMLTKQDSTTSADSAGNLKIVNQLKSEKVTQNKYVTMSNTFKSNLTQSSNSVLIEHTKKIKKIILYRHLLHLDFFQALNVEHIIKHQIPTIIIGSTHIQALIKFDNIKIRLNNKSLLALFPTWSRSMKWHLFIILNDIKEYHYTYTCNPTFEDVRDLRVRILHWLFQTAPKYSLARINFSYSTPELANCENINYTSKILSHSSLSKAISPRILEKISKYKTHFQIMRHM